MKQLKYMEMVINQELRLMWMISPSGIVAILENVPKYSVINITTEEVVNVKEMISIAKELTNNNVECINVKDREGQIYKEQILNNRLREFGWKPQYTFKEGMKLSYDYYLSNSNKWKSIFI